jgi:DNA polymerase-3 subunit epsilon
MDHRALLKTLLHELKDGVIVCDPEAKIILFNQAAEDLFLRSQALRTGKSLYNLCYRPPVEHAINLLTYQHDNKKQSEPLPFVQFLNASVNQEHFFRCRVSFLPPLAAAKNSFVIIFEDISAWYTPDNPLFMKVEEFRAPMTNMRAAVENLIEYPEMSPVMRSAFENVLVQESLNLTEVFDSLARSCNVLMQTQNHLTALNTEVLFGYVSQHLRNMKISAAASPDPSITVTVDIYGLFLLLDYLVDRIIRITQKQKKTKISCKAHIGDHFIYFDLLWPGEFMAPAAVQAMQEEKLEHSLGGMTVASILHAMGGDIWSQQHEHSESALRLALPIAIKARQ